MDKNIKVALGCLGSIIFTTGVLVGTIIQELHDKKTLKKSHDEIERVHKENEQLKIRILNKQS